MLFSQESKKGLRVSSPPLQDVSGAATRIEYTNSLSAGHNEAKHPQLRGLSQQTVRVNATDPGRDPPGPEMNNAGTVIRSIPASACAL